MREDSGGFDLGLGHEACDSNAPSASGSNAEAFPPCGTLGRIARDKSMSWPGGLLIGFFRLAPGTTTMNRGERRRRTEVIRKRRIDQFEFVTQPRVGLDGWRARVYGPAEFSPREAGQCENMSPLGCGNAKCCVCHPEKFDPTAKRRRRRRYETAIREGLEAS